MDRRVIIHCDDIGMTWGANEAAKGLLGRGIARSGSVMIPCPWAYEFIGWTRDNPGHDIGVHLTLNAEWDTYRWGPVAGRDKVPSLCDASGFLHAQHVETADAGEVLEELRAQVRQAREWGLEPTHLDIHMWMIYSRPEYYAAFLTLAEETGITPIILSRGPKEGLDFAEAKGLPVLASAQGLGGAYSYAAMRDQAFEKLGAMPEGTGYFIIHPNIDTPEMASVTNDHRNRQMNFDVFMDDATEDFLVSNGIASTTWREVVGR